MAHHPTDVAGGEVGFARLPAEDVLHRRGQRHRVAAGIALDSLGLPCRARRIERIAGRRGLDPGARNCSIEVLLAQHCVVDVAIGHAIERSEAPVDHQHTRRLVPCQAYGFVKQWLVGHDLAASASRIRTDNHRGLGVVDPAGQAMARESTEDH